LAGNAAIEVQMKRILSLCAIIAALRVDAPIVQAQLAGHGGPVRSIAISADGKNVLSGSFDTAAIRWSLVGGSAEQVLRFQLADEFAHIGECLIAGDAKFAR